MTNPSFEPTTIDDRIIQLVKMENPENIQQLLGLTKDRLGLSEKDALTQILRLIDDGKIKLKEPMKPAPKSSKDYIISSTAKWFWITVLLAFATVITVFTVPEDSYPLVYLRYVLGAVFVLILPGYAFIKALFPTQVPIKTSSENLDTIERAALSFGMSLALVPIVGLVLNYTPWGIRPTPITLSLLGLTLVFAVAALIRENHAKDPSRVKLPSSSS